MGSYAASDLCDRLTAEQLAAMKQKAKDEEEARQARKRAKKAEKKKKSKEVKWQKKAMQPLNIDWSKDKETEEAAATPTPTPRPSTSSTPAAPPTPAPWTLAPSTYLSIDLYIYRLINLPTYQSTDLSI